MEEKEFKFQIKGKAMVLIDWANIRNQQNKLGWDIDLERLYQWLSSYKEIGEVQFFYGYENNEASQNFLAKVASFGYEVITKEVKYLKVKLAHSNFREKMMLFHDAISDMNENGKFSLGDNAFEDFGEAYKKIFESVEIPKCDFDVEITTEIMKKFEKIQTIILFSGDGDFAYPIAECLLHWKKVIVLSHRDFVGKEIWNFKNKDPQKYPAIINLEKLDFLQKNPRQPKLTG